MPRNRWLTALLVASLALNLALLGAAAWRRLHSPHRPGYTPPDLRVDLPLADAQRRRVQALLRQFKIRSIIAREDILAKRVEILEELGEPDADEARVKQLTAELNRMEGELNQDFIASLLAISQQLDPPQRLGLLYRLSRSWYFAAPEAPRRHPQQGGPHEP